MPLTNRMPSSSQVSTRSLRLWTRWLLLFALFTGALLPAAQASITYRSSTSNPTDGASLDSTTVAVAQPSGLAAGDLLVMVANAREAGQALAISATGGQTWNTLSASSTNTTVRIFWARYNGTWSANPSVSFPTGANGTTVSLHAFYSDKSANSWAVDAGPVNSSYSAPGAGADLVTIAGITTVTTNTLVFATWASVDNNTWGIQTSGWSAAGSTQYRNGDGNDCSQSSYYQIKASTGATGTITNEQTGRGGDAGATAIVAFKEVPTTVVITSPSAQSEATTPLNFTVTQSAIAQGVTTSVPFTVANVTATGGASCAADVDYITPTSPVTVAAGSTTGTIPVTLCNDTLYESAETFTITITAPTQATLGATTVGTGTINDNEAAPSFAIAASSATEGSPITFTVTRTGNAQANQTVNYATSIGGSDTANSGDFTATSGTLTFVKGDTSKTFTVATTAETIYEANETFTVTLSTPTGGAIIGTATATGTINNDDAQPTITIAGPAATNEGNSGSSNFPFTVTLSNGSYQAVTVAYATSNGTATTADGDYTSTSGTLTFAAGTTTLTQTINVPVVGDTKNEANETFSVTLSSPGNATIGTASATATINNDDTVPTITIASPASQSEATTPLNFTVTQSAISGAATSVPFTVANVTTTGGASCAAGVDYITPTSPISISAGSTTGTIAVTLCNDTVYEATETFTITLGTPTNATLGATTVATGTITDNDVNAPTLATNTASSIGQTTATLNGTVSSNGASTTVTFNYGTTTDYGTNATAAESALVASASNASVTAAITGLTCNTLYHFRVSATNSVNLSTPTNGSDLTFTTSACTGPIPSASTSTVTASPASVEADNNSPSTITVTLKTSGGAPVAGKTVTLAQGSGSSTISTVTGTTGADGVATFSVVNSTDQTVTYTATDTTDSITITQTAQVIFTPSLCFYDYFTGSGTPGANWALGTVSGSFTPARVSNRLRMTDTGGGESTWISLNKYFPGAGNKITVEFDHLAYGGSGGDGIAMIISNAAITPAAGAFGGSLGYAPKSNPGSDCTTPGGCVGFAGGWMGVAMDEYGNYSNATEGRYGGTGFVVDSVAIRGSGSGMSGYRFITGTSTLSPGVDGNGSASPAHRYRVIVDHSDNLHAWISVERDTSGGGTSYTKLIGDTSCTTTPTGSCLDIKDPGYSQDAVPDNWRLSFTGSSGGATNTHEFDTLKVCTAQSIVTPTLHHLKLEHTGVGCTASGTSSSITVKACANAACSVLYPGTVTATLSATVSDNPATGTTWTTSPITFSGGSTTVSLANTNAETITLKGTDISPATVNATECYIGSTATCSMTFNACVFDAVEVGGAAYTPIYTKLSGAAFNLSIRNLDGTASRTANQVEIVDASSGTCSSHSALVDATTAVPSTFTASQVKTFAFTYTNSARNARIRITDSGGNKYCSYDNFAIRPQNYVLIGYSPSDTELAATQDSSATPTLKAGSDGFKIKANTSNTLYTGTPKFNSSLISTSLPHLGAISSASFPAATAGTSTGSGFLYSEVGNFTVGINSVYDDSFTAVDATKAFPECTSDFSNTANANGKYGCMFSNASALAVGRFVPDHFDTVLTAPMVCSTLFTGGGCPTLADGTTLSNQLAYSAQPFAVNITAKNSAGTTTENYTGTYAKTTALTAWDALGTTTLQNPPSTPSGLLASPTNATDATVANTNFSSGIASNVAASYAFKSWPTVIAPITATAAVAPVNIYLRAIDTDNVSSLRSVAPTTTSVEGGVRIISGRLLIENMYGPPAAGLQVTARPLYYDGSNWQNNPAASLTGTVSSNFSLVATSTCVSPTFCGVALGSATLSTASAGKFNVLLPAPTSGSGTRTVVLQSSASYLPGSGQQTWGVFRSPYIYMRER